MKNVLIGLILSAGLMSASADSKSVVISSGGYSNLVSIGAGGGAIINQIAVVSTTTNAASVKLYDTPNYPTYTNAAYIQLSSYATNYVTTYTNYFGVQNSITNAALVDYTNTVSAVTNSYPIPFIGTSPTNTASVYPGPYTFNNGVWATNTSAVGSVIVTIDYTK